MTSGAGDFLSSHQSRVNVQLDTFANAEGLGPCEEQSALNVLFKAGRYALSNGGKRIRPLLAYFSSRAVGGENILAATNHMTCAIELIHTYSLIHDDLPAMDDDDLRRGKPSLHKAYDEATAILVGDGLQARAFELLADAPGLSAEQKVHMIKVLAKAAGMQGMVGGQFIDIQATDSEMSLDALQAMHSLKTGALIRASLALGGIAGGANAQQLTALDEYGNHIGLAFQVVDDILDVEGDTQTLGKTQGKDGEANKPTYVKLLGLDGAKAEARRLLEEALHALR
ncbi:MAG TPA: farnesyl diphosphate synthase, partial [Halioglobus sp.]